MREVELLPTQDCEAGYGPERMTFKFIMILNVWGAIEGTLFGIFSLRSTGQTMADTGKFLVSGRILVFTRSIIFFYSHKYYIQNDDNMSHFFVFHDLKCRPIRHAVCPFSTIRM